MRSTLTAQESQLPFEPQQFGFVPPLLVLKTGDVRLLLLNLFVGHVLACAQNQILVGLGGASFLEDALALSADCI